MTEMKTKRIKHPERARAKSALDAEEYQQQVNSGEIAPGKPKRWTSEELSERNRIKGLRRFELHGNPPTPEACRKGGHTTASRRTPQEQAAFGRLAGRKNIETGWIQTLGRSGIGGRKAAELKVGVTGRSKEQMTKDGRKGGLKGGPIGGAIRAHNRWHRDRGITNPNCKLCRESQTK
jgi:hypothetical protein